jgi:hypothetical protein
MQRLPHCFWPLLLWGAGLVLAHHEMVLTGFAFTQSDLGDTRYVHYILEHGYRWFFGWPAHEEFWSPRFFHPAPNVAAYSEVMLGAAPFYWKWRLLRLEPDTAFQLWILTVSSLNFVSAHLLLRRGFTRSSLGAAFGAALFAYAASRINQTMHFQLFPHFWSMGCVYALVALFRTGTTERGRRRAIWIFALCAVAQLWASFYLGWFLGLGVTLALVVALVVPECRRGLFAVLRSHPATLVLASGISVVLLAPMATHFLEASEEVGMRSFQEALTMIPRPQAWFHLGRSSWLYGGLSSWPLFRSIPMEHEQRIGFGLATTAMCLAGLWRSRRDPAVRLVAVVGLVVVVMATLFGTFTLWRVVYELFPAAGAIRAVARVGLLLLIPMSLGLAVFVDDVAARGRRGLAAAVLLGLLVLAEQGQTTPSFSKAQNRADIAAIAQRIERHCDSFLFSPVRGQGPPWKYQLDAMWAQLLSGVPTLNGYSGSTPRFWRLRDVNLDTEFDEARVGAQLRNWISRRSLDPATTCWVRVALEEGPYGARLVSQRVPAKVVAGERYRASVAFENIGQLPWTRETLVRLGSQAPRDNTRWGASRVELPHDVAPGGVATFELELVAPAAPGVYTFEWRMLRENVTWFGEPSTRARIDVVAPGSLAPGSVAPDASP